ncbi:Ubiquitin-like modifier-activating enzyme ATG7 [Chlorella vulgaris]
MARVCSNQPLQGCRSDGISPPRPLLWLQGCGKRFAELWQLRQHHRSAPDATGSAQGHGCELTSCPRCQQALLNGRNARHRCKPQTAVPQAPEEQAALGAVEALKGEQDGRQVGKRRLPLASLRWLDLEAGAAVGAGMETAARGAAVVPAADAAPGPGLTTSDCAAAAAQPLLDPLPASAAMTISTAGGGGKARWWQIAVQPQRWQATAMGQLPSPIPLLQPPPVPVRVATLLAQLLALLQAVVSEPDAQSFIQLVLVSAAKQATADAATPGGGLDVGASLPSTPALTDTLLVALETNLSARVDAIRQLLAAQCHAKLAEGLQTALRCERLTAATARLTQSKVDVTFWSALGDFKLHDMKLEEGPQPLRGSWTPSNHAELPGVLTVSAASLPSATAAPAAGGFTAAGDLYVFNTQERLLQFDRRAAAAEVGRRMWEAIQTGLGERDPGQLLHVVLLAFCDLKHYKYRFWFGVPALQPSQPFTLAAPPISLLQALGQHAAAVADACSEHAAAARQPAWLVTMGSGGGVAAAPLTEWQRLQQGEEQGEHQLYLAVADSSNLADHPGWPLRNLLLLAAARWRCRSLRVLCLRQRQLRTDPAASLALTVQLPELPPGFSPAPLGGWEANERGRVGPRGADLGPSMDPRQLAAAAVDLNLRLMRWRAAPTLDVGAIAATRCLLLGAGTLGCAVARTLLGWGVRHITLLDNSRVAYSNPVRQSLYCFEDCLDGGKPKAQAAADALTRVFPGVVARGVQLSIPMPGHPLAQAELEQVQADIEALEALVQEHDVVFLLMDTRESRWLPTLLCAAHGRLAINAALGFDGFMVMRHGAPVPAELPAAAQLPAPGGLPAAAEAAAEGAAAAEAAELGRHLPVGHSSAAAAPPAAAAVAVAAEAVAPEETGAVAGTDAPARGAAAARAPGLAASGRLGCYFCNDVVAPLDSTLDRSLDQQCTVARPGLSAIAGSLAVELMAAVLQHPAGAAAPAAGTPAAAAAAQAATAAGEGEAAPLGDAPHMIRGQLGGFSQMCLSGQAFRQCTACSEAVVREYRRRGHAFLLQALTDPKHLEDLTGLTELHRSSEAALEAWASSDDEEQAQVASAAGGDDDWQAL